MISDDEILADATTDSKNDALPMRKDLPANEQTERPVEKDIHQTVGGKITDFFIYYVVGFFANSALSLGITYGVNPRPQVKTAKDNISKSLARVFSKANPENMYDGARSFIETVFMVCSGFIMTGIMTPMIKNRDQIAYWINQKIGKDTDVLPDHLKPVIEAKTIDEKIEQEINKRVNKHIKTSEIWIARVLSIAAVFVGDQIINSTNRNLEDAGKQSGQQIVWGIGQKIYDILPKKGVRRVNEWFTNHGAGIKDIQANMKDHFGRLEAVERKINSSGALNEDRIVVSEQTRLIGKELGWTMFAATSLKMLAQRFRDSRVEREKQQAIDAITKEGLVPDGHKIVLEGDRVHLEPVAQEMQTQWTKEVTGKKPIQSLGANAQQVVTTQRASASQVPGVA